MRLRFRLFGYTVASLTFDGGEAPELEEERYPIVGEHGGERIVFTPDQC